MKAESIVYHSVNHPEMEIRKTMKKIINWLRRLNSRLTRKYYPHIVVNSHGEYRIRHKEDFVWKWWDTHQYWSSFKYSSTIFKTIESAQNELKNAENEFNERKERYRRYNDKDRMVKPSRK